MMMLPKEVLRKEILKKRKGYNALITISDIKKYLKGVKVIALYYPLKNEINPLELLNHKEYKFCFPKVVGNDLVFYYDDPLEFSEGMFHVMEPKGKKICNKSEIDLFIVPLLGVNKDLYRIGYGKGFYDRYLKDARGFKLGLCYKDFLLDFKEDPYDIKLDEVIYCIAQ